MASSTDEQKQGAGGAEGSAAAAAKLPMIPLVMAMLVAVVLGAGGVGGAMLYMMKSGKLGGGTVTKVVEAHEVVKTHGIVMEPILVNLMDAGGKSFLRVAMTIQVEDEPKVKGAKEEKPAPGAKVPTEAETAARDTVLTVLGQQSADSLLEPDGKDQLKAKLKTELKTKNPELKMTDLFFTEFLVQR